MWVIFEGADGVGKTTTLNNVTRLLNRQEIWPTDKQLTPLSVGIDPSLVIPTRHPGSTKLGSIIRDIVKNPDKHGISLDPTSTQMLMFTDHINFKHTILLPALSKRSIVLCDRCDLISGLIYGTATGINSQVLDNLIQIAAGPRADRVYLLTCKDQALNKRMSERVNKDHFETSSMHTKVIASYKSLLDNDTAKMTLLNRIVHINNVKFIETGETSPDKIAQEIAQDIVYAYAEKYG